MPDKLNYDIKLSNIQETSNPLFSKAKAFIMYAGDNRNKSSMSKSVVEKAIPTLFNCPVIGEFNETIEDFKGHGGKIEITEEGINYIQTTRPYGVIPESSDVKWEYVTENDGTIREYLTCDVYLWTSRYPEVESVVNDGKGQSMEIENISGDFNNNGVFVIDDFTFSALCILGDEHEPCFEGASIKGYTLDKETFKAEFNLMIQELKNGLNNESLTGGVIVEKNKENLETTEEEVKEEQFEENNEEIKEEEQTEEVSDVEGSKEVEAEVDDEKEAPAEEEFETNSEEETEELNEDKEQFALSNEQKRDEIRRALQSQKYKDDWGYEWSCFYYVDFDDEYVYAEDEQNGCALVGISYSMNGDLVALDFESINKVKITYEFIEEGSQIPLFEIVSNSKMEDVVNASNKKLEAKDDEIFKLNEKITNLEKSLNELNEFKLEKENADKENIFTKFSIALTDEEMQPVMENKDNLSLSEIKNKLNEIYTEKNLKPETKEEIIKVDIHKKDSPKSKYAC